MIKTTDILLRELKEYSNAKGKLQRLVKQGICFPIIKGLYETDKNTPGHYLAESIYGPSYLSFEFALGFYDLIPEHVCVYTSASFEKRKAKRYETLFGIYTYRDIPAAVYPYGIRLCEENGYGFKIASPEKAVCDQLYKAPTVANRKELKRLLFEDLCIEEDLFSKLNKADMIWLAEKYRSKNLKLLGAYLKSKNKGESYGQRN